MFLAAGADIGRNKDVAEPLTQHELVRFQHNENPPEYLAFRAEMTGE